MKCNLNCIVYCSLWKWYLAEIFLEVNIVLLAGRRKSCLVWHFATCESDYLRTEKTLTDIYLLFCISDAP